MAFDWTPLRHELALWQGEPLTFWWRDDDAVAGTPALERLCALSERTGVPLHLAVIPKLAEGSLVEVCAAPNVVPIVHGWAHENRALAGEKKAEFGRPREGLAADAEAGLARLRDLFGADLLPVFVPPWNRVHPSLPPQLTAMGYRGLSTYTPRAARFAAPGLVQINTHIDPIHWRGGGGLLAEEVLMAQLVTALQDRREGRMDGAEPLGLLTHHLVHDADIWGFVEGVLEELLAGGAVPVDLWALKDRLP